MVVVYLGLRWLVNSKAGRVMIAIREDAERTEALGYDIRAIQPGALRCIIGPNGAGKSTFFKLLLGSIKPDKGTIMFRGRDVTRAEPHRHAHMGIGVKFQHLGVYGDLTVRHNMQLPLRHSLSGEAMDAEIARLLERLNLTGTEERRVAELSHDHRRRARHGVRG